MVYYVALIMRYWIGNDQSQFYYKITMVYFRAFWGSRIAVYSPFMQKLPLVAAPDHSSNPPKQAPVIMVFVLYEGSKGIM